MDHQERSTVERSRGLGHGLGNSQRVVERRHLLIRGHQVALPITPIRCRQGGVEVRTQSGGTRQPSEGCSEPFAVWHIRAFEQERQPHDVAHQTRGQQT